MRFNKRKTDSDLLMPKTLHSARKNNTHQRSRFKKSLAWLASQRPAREIVGDEGEPYLNRYFLCQAFGCTAYLHHFVDSDPGGGYHDHPWRWFYSLCLAGGYIEVSPLGERHHTPGRLSRMNSTDTHRVVLPPNSEAWTLFIHGPRIKGWGFFRWSLKKLRYEYIAVTVSALDNPYDKWWKTAPKGKYLVRTNGIKPSIGHNNKAR